MGTAPGTAHPTARPSPPPSAAARTPRPTTVTAALSWKAPAQPRPVVRTPDLGPLHRHPYRLLIFYPGRWPPECRFTPSPPPTKTAAGAAGQPAVQAGLGLGVSQAGGQPDHAGAMVPGQPGGQRFPVAGNEPAELVHPLVAGQPLS